MSHADMVLVEALRLQWEWGAEEALLDAPQDRRHAAAPAAPVTPAQRASTAPPEHAGAAPPQHAGAAPPQRPRARAPSMPAGPAEAAQIAARCQSLETLQAAMASFTGCALRDTATQLVFADGAADAGLMIIGEAPGAEEDRAGKPFVGPAGQLLDRMLGSIGLDRRQARIANVVPWRPPGNRTPTEAEIALCLPFLHRQIALIRPRGLLLLGAVAAKALLAPPERDLGISRLRGTWRQINIEGLDSAVPALPSFHPAYLLRMPTAKAQAWRDLLALREWVESADHKANITTM